MLNILNNKLSILRLFMASIATLSLIYSIHTNGNSILQVLSMFTYVSNIAVILVLFLVGIKLLDDKNILLVVPQITITCIVYSTLLSHGFMNEAVVSKIEHYIIPIYLICDYLMFVKERVSFKKAFIVLLIFIIVYLVYIFSYGYFSGNYPYYFVDIKNNSLAKVTTTVSTIIVSSILILIIFYIFKAIQLYVCRK